MTTIREEPIVCALCGATTVLPVLGSTSSFGPPDLDLRPAEPARSSLFAWIQRCGSCGYCAPSIDVGSEWLVEIVESAEYRRQLDDPGFPELAKRFLCSAMVLEDGEEAAAAHDAIRAAWACDDANAHSAARWCRSRAVELAHESEAEGDALYSDPATEYAVVLDLLRRAGQFEGAIAQADEALEDADGEVACLLTFGRALAIAADVGRYTVEAALATDGASDEQITDALRTLVAFGDRADYFAKAVVLRVDDARNYYIQFAVDEGGLFCEVVHNKYLAPADAFTGDDIATLLALGFEGPDHEDQNLVRVFRPSTAADYDAIVGLVRTIVTDFFGQPAAHAIALKTSW